MRTSSVVTATPNLRLEALEGDREVQVALAPELGLVDLVVAARRRAAGSSSTRRCRAVASLSSSAASTAATATQCTGSGRRARGTVTGVPLGARVSPVTVPASLATAAMSPAGTVGDIEVLSAAQREQPVEPLVGAGAGVHEVVVGS